MPNNLSGSKIDATYQQVIHLGDVSSPAVYDGTGSLIQTLPITSSYSVSSSYVLSSQAQFDPSGSFLGSTNAQAALLELAEAFTNTPAPVKEIAFAISDETTDLTDNGGLPVYTGIIPRNITFTEIIASQTTPSDIGDYTFYDIHINGSTIFGTPLIMDGGANSSIGSSIPYTLVQSGASKGDLIEVYITYVAATTPGTGAKIYILGT